MVQLRRLLLFSLMEAWVVMVLACSGASQNPRGADENLITYEVLEQRRGQGREGKVFLYILVSENASKEDVMKLAESLWQRDDIDTLQVFDARAAYESDAWERRNGRDDPSYPEREFRRHHLASGVLKSFGGDQEIHWVAVGRGVQLILGWDFCVSRGSLGLGLEIHTESSTRN